MSLTSFGTRCAVERREPSYFRRRWRFHGIEVETRDLVPNTERIDGITVEEYSDLETAGEMIERYRWWA